MAELIPYSFGKLVTRIFREWEIQKSIFDIKQKSFFHTPENLDFSIQFHNKRAATPFGPASGPHAQMAQNIAMSWLCGARIIELKTVQILDELDIPRPCIDVPNVGYNVEWSQELKIEESLHEYVKGSMLIDILKHSGIVSWQERDLDTVLDISLGYDLKGIQSDKIQHYVSKMRDASDIVDLYRQQIPQEYAHLRDIPFTTKIADSVTLSTFHGCPPDEVEKIASFLIREMGLNTIVKFNPTLLGKAKLREILHERLEYTDLVVPDKAFDDDMQWDQALGICERMKKLATDCGVSYGAKFTNTLIVENYRKVFAEKEEVMYASGAPLHVLAIQIVSKFREHFGNEIPISFSAGIAPNNFHHAASLGFKPITVCTDLLRKGGYARSAKYFQALAKDMKKHNCNDIPSYITARAQENDSEVSSLSQALKVNSLNYAAAVADPEGEYHQSKHTKTPPKPGTKMKIFDCLTCDICIPVCPNHANFSYFLEKGSVPVTKFVRKNSMWEKQESGEVSVNKRHQIANFADFCNECGNCDTFCPDLGGPYILKPRFFSSLEQWQEDKQFDGFFLKKTSDEETLWARFDGNEYTLKVANDHQDSTADLPPCEFNYRGKTFRMTSEGIQGDAAEGTEIDGTYLIWMNLLRRGVNRSEQVNYAMLSGDCC
ncbi:4Fe-4S dicluster domain-containing protein [Candidatus Uabimicrobium amorphum]|uniref:Putative selenate reductase subunit YgfK n=1 Tax=Uabimicrobium amorphum TaxID=2596890 RepID=A0A5S9F0W5_UABAM|nr:4Fe-4S dicluster domain-containing protein [Candidatus Uabimicrobium amorphum]BBM81788.1 putative selenate reductase subunit YgfK [Candidatus Uabimicrobium amorphum]